MSKWFLSASGCACWAAALLWQPPFTRQLIVCGLIALLFAGRSYLRELVEPR